MNELEELKFRNRFEDLSRDQMVEKLERMRDDILNKRESFQKLIKKRQNNGFKIEQGDFKTISDFIMIIDLILEISYKNIRMIQTCMEVIKSDRVGICERCGAISEDIKPKASTRAQKDS